jgi:hypothetical protein
MSTTIDQAATAGPVVRPGRSLQAPSAVVMVRPHHVAVNEQTSGDNVFQSRAATSALGIADAAFAESTALADALIEHGVRVHLFDDASSDRPDSVFPNNWLSTHRGGRIVTYPMCTPNRRFERRHDIVELLKGQYRVQDVIDYSGLEYDGLFLEGTGAMVLDHIARIAYVARSHRADPVILERFCTHNGYEPMVFDAVDQHGTAIYHTNVLMCVATDFALVCLESIIDLDRRSEIVERLVETGRTPIDISPQQMREFAANAFELSGRDGRLLAMSTAAHNALTAEQIALIESSCEIVAVDVSTIELAGGSVRCMLAGVHLDPRPV